MKKVITIFGGNCNLAKYIVSHLAKNGFYVNIIRENSENDGLKIYGLPGQVSVNKINIKDYNELTNVIKISEAVINLSDEKSYKKKSSLMFLENALPNYTKANNKKYIHIIPIANPFCKTVENIVHAIDSPSVEIIKIGDFLSKENEIILAISELKNCSFLPIESSAKKSKLNITYIETILSKIDDILNKEQKGVTVSSLIDDEILKTDFCNLIIGQLESSSRLIFLPTLIANCITFATNLIPGKMIASFCKLLDPSNQINCETKIVTKDIEKIKQSICKITTQSKQHYLSDVI